MMATPPNASCVDLPLEAVHVWYLYTDRVTDPGVLDRYRYMMSDDERRRCERFVFSKDRHAFVIARGLVRTVLSRYAGIAPAACGFVTNQFGKPSLRRAAHEPALEFNVSHTSGLVAIAVTLEREIGIDVEEVTRAAVTLGVSRFFSAAEIRALDGLPDAEQRSRCFDFWTLKEAYLKARGIGLSLPLNQFSMRVDHNGPPTIEFGPGIDDDPAAWQFARFDLAPRHRMALAVRRRGPDLAISIRAFDVNHPTT